MNLRVNEQDVQLLSLELFCWSNRNIDDDPNATIAFIYHIQIALCRVLAQRFVLNFKGTT